MGEPSRSALLTNRAAAPTGGAPRSEASLFVRPRRAPRTLRPLRVPTPKAVVPARTPAETPRVQDAARSRLGAPPPRMVRAHEPGEPPRLTHAGSRFRSARGPASGSVGLPRSSAPEQCTRLRAHARLTSALGCAPRVPPHAAVLRPLWILCPQLNHSASEECTELLTPPSCPSCTLAAIIPPGTEPLHSLHDVHR